MGSEKKRKPPKIFRPQLLTKTLEMTGQGQCPNAYKAQSLDKAKSLNYTSELMQLAGIAFAMGNPMAELQAHFFKAVESWQAVFSVRALKLSNPQTMNHLIF
jgi:hypothetical protein